MSGLANYPTALDDDTSLHDVVENVTSLVAAHHNNTKEAVKALEARVGVYSSDDPDSIDYRLGSATDSHSHNGASGQGQQIDASAILAQALASVAPRVSFHSADNSVRSAIASQVVSPIVMPRTMYLESVNLGAIRGPSGGTTVIDVNFGATSIWYATQAGRLMMGPTAGRMVATTSFTPNQITAASGILISWDVDAVGANVGYDRGGIVLVFRE